MKLRDIMNITEARCFSPNTNLDCEIQAAFASDLMSDVLCHDVCQGLMITGLTNPQTMRTAEMAEVAAILVVRGKEPVPETLRLEQELGIPVIGTQLIMFETCGRLHQAGLPACSRRED
jgi:predicted transcriptional regulator